MSRGAYDRVVKISSTEGVIKVRHVVVTALAAQALTSTSAAEMFRSLHCRTPSLMQESSHWEIQGLFVAMTSWAVGLAEHHESEN